MKVFKNLMPLFIIQFFTWTAMFALWIYATPLVLKLITDTKTPGLDQLEDAVKWVGIFFAFYSVIAGLLGFLLLKLYTRFNYYSIHSICLFTGALGFLLLYYSHTFAAAFTAFTLVGICWAGVGNLTYKMVGLKVPEGEENIYYTTFNLSIVIPQVIASFLLHYVLYRFFNGEVVYSFLLGAFSMFVAAIICLLQWSKNKNAREISSDQFPVEESI